ncbi:hypothetical protein DPX16_17463 [Anabarilius grahami]|uniref:Uncharacterized protein n=1 Tax=Anabarilius grahami TaxID=495550 RepID=A0A3N0Y0R5_ANAGA|nr:hypothetical protein DPX16_17463 [Anabarilius grahami]
MDRGGLPCPSPPEGDHKRTEGAPRPVPSEGDRGQTDRGGSPFLSLQKKGKRLCYPDSLRGKIPPGNKQVARGSDEGNVSPSVPNGKVCVRGALDRTLGFLPRH